MNEFFLKNLPEISIIPFSNLNAYKNVQYWKLKNGEIYGRIMLHIEVNNLNGWKPINEWEWHYIAGKGFKHAKFENKFETFDHEFWKDEFESKSNFKLGGYGWNSPGLWIQVNASRSFNYNRIPKVIMVSSLLKNFQDGECDIGKSNIQVFEPDLYRHIL